DDVDVGSGCEAGGLNARKIGNAFAASRSPRSIPYFPPFPTSPRPLLRATSRERDRAQQPRERDPSDDGVDVEERLVDGDGVARVGRRVLVDEERADEDDRDVHGPAEARDAREGREEEDREDVERGRDAAPRGHAELRG